jgi:rhodanese-related sulfurtransferase
MILLTKYDKPVPEGGDWRAPYHALALETKIGEESQIPNADNPLERNSAARVSHLFLQNALGEADETTTYGERDLKDFSSCASCLPHVDQIYTKGIASGRPGGTYDGFAVLTRAEACVMVMKTIDASLRVPPSPDGGETPVSGETITPAEALALIAEKGAVLIDARTEEEYAIVRIPGSVLIPLDTLADGNDKLPADKDAFIVVHCQSGKRSKQARDILMAAGYSNVYDAGGINDWPEDKIETLGLRPKP